MSAPIKTKIEVQPSEVAEDISKTSTPRETTAPKIPVVRTLKPPPEIWELVHPVPPKQPRPASALVDRIASGRSIFILLTAVVVLIGVYVGLRSGKGIAGVSNTQLVPVKRVEPTKTGIADSQKPTLEENVPVPQVTSAVEQPIDLSGANLRRKPSRRGSKPVGAVTQVDKSPVVTEATTAIKTGSALQSSQISQPTDQETRSLTSASERSRNQSDDSVSASRKTKTTLSRQLIDSPQTSTPRKAKVIPWP